MTQLFIIIVCSLLVVANATVWGDEYGAGVDPKSAAIGVIASLLLFAGGYLIGSGK